MKLSFKCLEFILLIFIKINSLRLHFFLRIYCEVFIKFTFNNILERLLETIINL